MVADLELPPTEKTGELFQEHTRLDVALERCETDWQRVVMREWCRLNPSLVAQEIVPTACTCLNCRTPSLIIPDLEIKPQRAYVICPRCSKPEITGGRMSETLQVPKNESANR